MFRHTDSGFDQRIRWQKSTSSGNVGTQYPNDVGSEWFGTIENLNAGLAQGKVHCSDVYKTDVLWTTPSADRDECDARKNAFNAVCHRRPAALRPQGPLRRAVRLSPSPRPASTFRKQTVFMEILVAVDDAPTRDEDGRETCRHR